MDFLWTPKHMGKTAFFDPKMALFHDFSSPHRGTTIFHQFSTSDRPGSAGSGLAAPRFVHAEHKGRTVCRKSVSGPSEYGKTRKIDEKRSFFSLAYFQKNAQNGTFNSVSYM